MGLEPEKSYSREGSGFLGIDMEVPFEPNQEGIVTHGGYSIASVR